MLSASPVLAWISGFRFWFWLFGSRVLRFGSRGSGFGFHVSGVGFHVSGFGFHVLGFGQRTAWFSVVSLSMAATGRSTSPHTTIQ